MLMLVRAVVHHFYIITFREKERRGRILTNASSNVLWLNSNFVEITFFVRFRLKYIGKTCYYDFLEVSRK